MNCCRNCMYYLPCDGGAICCNADSEKAFGYVKPDTECAEWYTAAILEEDNDAIVGHIQSKVPEAARFEMLAEEAAELAHAALKVARIVRGENPTPVSYQGAVISCAEELADVAVAAEVAGMKPDEDAMCEKLMRWIDRLEERG